jgi:hypothetical protein
MDIIKHNPDKLYPTYKNFSHAIEVRNSSRQLIIGGLNGYLKDGKIMPASFEEQGMCQKFFSCIVLNLVQYST